MNRLENKVAIITGAAGGMGAVEAKVFAKEGAKVLVTDVQEEKLKAVVAEIIADGGIAEYILHDVITEESWKGAAGEFAKDNIRVNSVHPGYVATPMTLDMKGSGNFEKGAVGLTPMGRGAKMEEIAYGVLFLATDESSYMTGTELIIDGGNTAM